jgi:hypothetical protein
MSKQQFKIKTSCLFLPSSLKGASLPAIQKDIRPAKVLF